MRRDSQAYQERKAAWELVQSDAWGGLLKPLLERKLQSRPGRILSLDQAFQAAAEQGAIEFAQYLLHRVEKHARDFPTVSVDPNSLPS